MGSQILDIIKIFMVCLGAFSTAWGLYELWNDAGGQAAIGNKKVMGGIAFMILSGIIMTMIINDIKKAEQSAGVTTGYLEYSHFQNAEQQSVIEFNNIIVW